MDGNRKYFSEHPEKLVEFIKNGIKSKHGHITINKSINKDFYYMSSWEKRFVEYCDNLDEVVEIKSGTLFRISYIFKRSNHYYIPDVILTLSGGENIMIEIKPKSKLKTKKNKAKFKAARKWCKENNFKYLILTEEEVFNDTLSIYSLIK